MRTGNQREMMEIKGGITPNCDPNSEHNRANKAQGVEPQGVEPQGGNMRIPNQDGI